MTLPSETTRIVYLSFDRFPSPKGAATHIDAFIRVLGKTFGGVDLLTIPSKEVQIATMNLKRTSEPAAAGLLRSPPDLPLWSAEGVSHHPIDTPGENLFERVLSFRAQSENWWWQQFENGTRVAPVVHFRSIFEGYPIARRKNLFCDKIVFEVNGLPSIELKYRYPRVADDVELLRKIEHQEQVCLDAADLVITVSNVNAAHLQRRGVEADRIRVIPNGVDLDVFTCHRPQLSDCSEVSEQRPLQMLYSGTMSAWQGVFVAIEALALFRRDLPAKLMLVGPALVRQKKEILNYAWRLGISEHVELLEPVSKPELGTLYHQSDVIVAPLTANDRNLVQGCCPLKVIESMASGTPLIASDLPVVRELVTGDLEALLVRPGSAKAIKDGMFRLLNERHLAERLSQKARARVEQNFSWSKAQASLVLAYKELLGSDGFIVDTRVKSSVSRSASTPE